MSQDAYLLKVRNVNRALPQGLALLREYGHKISPRGKETLEYPGPVMTTYSHPEEMVLFDPLRDANPFFHFFEALWILAGRSDVAFLAHFNARMAEFSDNGKTFHAPYGWRLRHPSGVGRVDQIETCIKLLKEDHDTRQAVMSIWEPYNDLRPEIVTNDRPCNDMVFLKIRDGALRMTVAIRSNDIVWGAYGANAVQFATLLKYMAGRIGVGVGTLTQVSDSYHVYTDLPFWQEWSERTPGHSVPWVHDPYSDADVPAMAPSPYMTGEELASGAFDRDLKLFFEVWNGSGVGPDTSIVNTRFETDSFNNTVRPMFMAHRGYKLGLDRYGSIAVRETERVEARDWGMAAEQWLMRRLVKRVAS